MASNENFVPRNTTKRLVTWAGVVAGILAIPLIFNAPWTVGDFVFGSIVLMGAATTFELITRNMKNPNHRLVVGAVVLMVLFLIWGAAATGE